MPVSDYSYRSTTGSERSDSGNEVEKMLLGQSSRITAGWGPAAARNRPGELIDQAGYRIQLNRFFEKKKQLSHLLLPNELQKDSDLLFSIRDRHHQNCITQ